MAIMAIAPPKEWMQEALIMDMESFDLQPIDFVCTHGSHDANMYYIEAQCAVRDSLLHQAKTHYQLSPRSYIDIEGCIAEEYVWSVTFYDQGEMYHSSGYATKGEARMWVARTKRKIAHRW